MSGQLESFLHAIRETPEDNVPRLVLADWFEDNGDPHRAEFVRTQIRLAGDLPDDERRERMQEGRNLPLRPRPQAFNSSTNVTNSSGFIRSGVNVFTLSPGSG